VVGLTLRKFTPLPKDFFRISLKWVHHLRCSCSQLCETACATLSAAINLGTDPLIT
jgi:hypothetical protein